MAKINSLELKIKQAIPLAAIEAEKEKIKVGDYISLEGDAFKVAAKMTGGYDYTGKNAGRIVEKSRHVFVIDCGNYKSAIRYSALLTEGAKYRVRRGNNG